MGAVYDYQRDPVGYLADCFDSFGDTFSLTDRTIVTRDVAVTRDVCRRTNEDFSLNIPRIGSGRNGSGPDTDPIGWMEVRRLGWEGMNRKALLTHGHRFLETLGRVIQGIEGRTIDPAGYFRQWVGSLVADFCLGTGHAEIARLADERSEAADRLVMTGLTFPEWFPSPTVRRAVRSGQRLKEEIGSAVREKRGAFEDDGSLLFRLTHGPGSTLSDDKIAQVLRMNLLASYSTPAAPMAWIVRYLGSRPETVRAIRAEVDELSPEELVGAGVTGGLKFTDAFVREVLRLYPPIWLIARLAERETQVGRWTLKRGQTVCYSPYFMHRDPDWWPQPNVFDVTRWLDDTQRSNGAYAPFGWGPRICLGMHVGLYQLTLFASWIAKNTEVTVVRGEDGVAATPTVVPQGLRITVADRRT